MTLGDKDPIRELADRAVRESLLFGEHLRGLLSRVVPELADGFDYDRIRPLGRDFPIEDWRQREADLPIEVPFRHGAALEWALVVVLLEHQSDTDTMMPLRLLYFAAVYWDQQWRQWQELPAPRPPLRLNPVLPIVVYTGAKPWGSNRTLADLLGEPAALHGFAPTLQPIFWNLADQTPEDLLASENTWLQLMAMLRVEDAELARFREVYTRVVAEIGKIQPSAPVRWAVSMRIALTWVFWRRPADERPELLAIAEQAQASVKRRGEIKRMASDLGPTMVDLALEQGLKKGRQVGREEGRREGRREGSLAATRRILKTLLQGRFGRLPRKLQQQIDAVGDEEALLNAIHRVHDCASLADFHL